LGLIPNETRFLQTIESISSIREHIKNVVIILIDNSTQPLTHLQKQIITDNTDYFIYVGDRKSVIDINRYGIKGAVEYYMLITAFDFIITNCLLICWDI
jgi:dihydrodipicolinate synthase/N-acetylneuraminate lyase